MLFFRNSTFVQTVAGLCLACMLVVTSVSAQDACVEGRVLASERTSSTIWFLAGCTLSGLGVLGAYVIQPDPPMTALVGKDAAYVAQLTDCYKDQAGGIQTKWAWIGCATIAVPYIIYALAFGAAVASM